MNIGIITINDNNNYGNRLQNYAVQITINNLNLKNLTIKNEPYLNSKKFYFFRQVKNLIRKNIIKKKIFINIDRASNFAQFNKNIKFSDKKVTAYSKLKNYDYVITGSDQVWNPTFGRLRDVDLLTIVPGDKRIALSASFGVNDIPDKLKPKVAKELSKFKAISVREDRGKEIVEELTGRKDVEVLVDPTMLLTAEEWDKVSKKPKMLKTNKYILNYFLGDLSDERRKEIDRVAKENNCEVINILDKNSPFYECGPSEFLYLEKNAFLICTDSFHSCVFAILYNTPFFLKKQYLFASLHNVKAVEIYKFYCFF